MMTANRLPRVTSLTSSKTVCLLISAIVALLYVVSIIFDVEIASLRGVYGFDGRGRRRSDVTKTILYWNGMFGNDSYLGGDDPFANCAPEAANCLVTRDRKLLDVEDFDAILFHANELDRKDLPSRRRARQRYVYVNLESPANRPLRDPFFEDYFNLTMTYRLDSDVVWPYGFIEEAENGTVVAPTLKPHWGKFEKNASDGDFDAAGNKSKMVVWFVSNCHSLGGRQHYVKELAKHINVDVFGNCGDRETCPRSRDCFRGLVQPTYYFYLSFENSLCHDYVTEKLYNALRYNVVPIVYGGADYRRFAPPHSYVNALDYDSPRELAEFLKRLSQNRSEYNEYFRWKRRYRVSENTSRSACALCGALHRDDNTTKRYDPLSAWYKSDKCPLQERLQEVSYLTKASLKSQI